MEENAPVATRHDRSRVVAFLSRYVERHVIHFVAISVLALAALYLVLGCSTQWGSRLVFGTNPGADYSCFYVAGTLLNEYPAERLYDFDLQSELYHALLPDIPPDQELPFVNPPFFGLVFRPLALLPYTASYLCWVAISFGLYIGGFLLLRRTLQGVPAALTATSLLLALSFAPFLFECAIGANSSAVGFFFLSLALRLERQERRFASGAALAFCLYKPTLLVLIGPMLVVGRRFRTLAGLAIGGSLLAVLSVAAIGWESSMRYAEILLDISDASVGTTEVFRTTKYVEILTFARLLAGGSSALSWSIVAGFTVVSLPFLVAFWWNFGRRDAEYRALIWSATICWTPVFNLHVGIYDTVIVVVGMLLTADVLGRRSVDAARPLAKPFLWLVGALYLAGWLSQPSAKLLGVQLLTLMLYGAGAYSLLLARVQRTGHDRSCQPRPTSRDIEA